MPDRQVGLQRGLIRCLVPRREFPFLSPAWAAVIVYTTQVNIAIIVGNGPSVDALPVEFWLTAWQRNVLLIGTNRALALTATANLEHDVLVMRDRYTQLWLKQELGAKYHTELWKPNRAYKVGSASSRTAHCNEYVAMTDSWQHDVEYDRNRELLIGQNDSVVLMATNWAWLVGIRSIGLVGVDYYGGHASMIDPYNASTRGVGGALANNMDSIERQFGTAVKEMTRSGGEIVNLSPATQLRSVPKMHWKSFLG